jgi:uncharacterized protein (DUF58 family)
MRLPRLPLLTALVLLLFFAYITGIRLAYTLLYAFVLLLVASYAWSRLAGEQLSIRRESPEGQYQVGDTFEERFKVENSSWIPIPVIEVVDFSNIPGYRPDRVFSLKGRRFRGWASRGTFKQRGLFTFGPIELRYGDPFGLFPRTLRVSSTNSVVVYPQIRPVGHLDVLSMRAQGDEHVRGRVLDIPPNATTIREYVPTDSFKRIHWASSARLGRLVSRSFETREGGDAWIVLDLDRTVHAGEAPESTLEYGVSLAASIADAGLRRGAAIGLLANDHSLSLLDAARGDQQRKKLLEFFTLAAADGDVPLATMLAAHGHRWRRGGGLVVVTPSSDPQWVEALLDLGVRGQRSLVVYLDPQAFHGTQPALAIASRWRQSLSWWMIRPSEALEGEEEQKVAAR